MTSSTGQPRSDVSETQVGDGRFVFRLGIGVATLISFLTVWTTIVRDDGNGMSFFMLIMAAIVGGFASSFRAAGLARTMAGVAIMQILLGIAVATAPITAQVPGAPLRALIFSGVFAALWLLSAAFFRASARSER